MATAMAMATIPASRIPTPSRISGATYSKARARAVTPGTSPAGGVALSDADTAYTSLMDGYVTANDADNSMLMELPSRHRTTT